MRKSPSLEALRIPKGGFSVSHHRKLLEMINCVGVCVRVCMCVCVHRRGGALWARR